MQSMFLPKQEQQKSSSFLFMCGILQSCITSFWVAALGCPNLECQVLAVMELREAYSTRESACKKEECKTEFKDIFPNELE